MGHTKEIPKPPGNLVTGHSPFGIRWDSTENR